MDTLDGNVLQEIYLESGEQLVKYCNDGNWISKVCGSEIDCNNNVDDDCDTNIDEVDECTTIELKLNLHKGWNILPITINPDIKEIDKALALILDNVVIVREYISTGVLVYDTSVPARFNTLQTIAGGKAYQVKMKDAGELTLTGMPFTKTSVKLHKGWNKITYLGDDVVDIEPTIESIKDNVVIIREYAKSGVLVYDTSIPARFNTLKQFKPDTGYQIKMRDKSEVNLS